MSPSCKEANLEELLSDDLVSSNGGAALKHKLMQLSVFTYIEKTKEVECVEMELPLKYVGPQTLYKLSGKKRLNKKAMKKLERRRTSSQRISNWPVDVAVVYREGNKRVCELIEVETINMVEFWERLESISMKTKKVEEIYRNKQLNPILNDVDEVRFSLAMNASGLDDGVTRYLTDEFKRRFNGISKSSEVKAHNMYVLRGNVYEYCPQEMNSMMLDSLTPGYSIRNDYKEPLKSIVTAAYRKIRSLGLPELEKLYNVSTLAQI